MIKLLFRTEQFLFAVAIALTLGLLGSVTAAQQDSGQPATRKAPEYSAEARLAWHADHLKMRDSSPYKSLEWEHIGPSHMSGRVTDIAKPLDQPFTFYVTTASGGVWKTINEGTSWKPIFDDAPSAAWGAIAVDPSDSNTIWIGGGESNIFRSSMAGTGVYKSTDAGETWEHMGLADTQHIARIVVHPTDSNIVYIAAGGHEYTEQRAWNLQVNQWRNHLDSSSF